LDYTHAKMKRAPNESLGERPERMRKGNDGGGIPIKPMSAYEELYYAALKVVLDYSCGKLTSVEYNINDMEAIVKIAECFPILTSAAVTSFMEMHRAKNKLNLDADYADLIRACLMFDCNGLCSHLEQGSPFGPNSGASIAKQWYEHTFNLKGIYRVAVVPRRVFTMAIPHLYAIIAHGTVKEAVTAIHVIFCGELCEEIAGPAFELACALAPKTCGMIECVYSHCYKSIFNDDVEGGLAILLANAYITKDKEELATITQVMHMLSYYAIANMNLFQLKDDQETRKKYYFARMAQKQCLKKSTRFYTQPHDDCDPPSNENPFKYDVIRENTAVLCGDSNNSKCILEECTVLVDDFTYAKNIFHHSQNRVDILLCLLAAEELIQITTFPTNSLGALEALVRLFVMGKYTAAARLGREILFGINHVPLAENIGSFIGAIALINPIVVGNALEFLGEMLSIPPIVIFTDVHTSMSCTTLVCSLVAWHLVSVDIHKRDTAITTIDAYVKSIQQVEDIHKKQLLVFVTLKALDKAGLLSPKKRRAWEECGYKIEWKVFTIKDATYMFGNFAMAIKQLRSALINASAQQHT
jgi:hypothetical protein